MQKLSKPQSADPSRVPAAHKRLARGSQLDRKQLDEYASRVMALEDSGESFVQKMHRLFSEAGECHLLPLKYTCSLHKQEHGRKQSMSHSRTSAMSAPLLQDHIIQCPHVQVVWPASIRVVRGGVGWGRGNIIVVIHHL